MVDQTAKAFVTPSVTQIVLGSKSSMNAGMDKIKPMLAKVSDCHQLGCQPGSGLQCHIQL